MTYNEALLKNALINELGQIKGLKAKAMTEKILLSIHYRKAMEEWTKAREAIDSEADADEKVKQDAVNAKVMEDCGLDERRMSAEAFEQVVEAALAVESVQSVLAVSAEGEAPKIPAAGWLQAFAEVLVKA